MSDTILALLGFATVIAVIVLLLRNVTVPALAFVSVSTITAAILVATGAFTLDEMAGFIKEGVKGVHGTAVLFIFSVLFFGVMTDAGMFDKIIGALMKKVGNNVVPLCYHFRLPGQRLAGVGPAARRHHHCVRRGLPQLCAAPLPPRHHRGRLRHRALPGAGGRRHHHPAPG